MASGWGVVVSCEHAGNQIPARFRRVFKSQAARQALKSHRGWDPGSLTLGHRLSRAFDAPIVVNRVSRLLAEVNRSPGHARLFSEYARSLAETDRQFVLDTIYKPHRDCVESTIRDALRGGSQVLHIGSHSFTPSLNGEKRNADIGFLYDPRRKAEKKLCIAWQAALREMDSGLRVRRNYPYLGSADGLTTFLRKTLRTPRYLGIELEVNQRFLQTEHRRDWLRLQKRIVESLRSIIIDD